jgi:hypothetical protein
MPYDLPVFYFAACPILQWQWTVPQNCSGLVSLWPNTTAYVDYLQVQHQSDATPARLLTGIGLSFAHRQ